MSRDPKIQNFRKLILYCFTMKRISVIRKTDPLTPDQMCPNQNQVQVSKPRHPLQHSDHKYINVDELFDYLEDNIEIDNNVKVDNIVHDDIELDDIESKDTINVSDGDANHDNKENKKNRNGQGEVCQQAYICIFGFVGISDPRTQLSRNSLLSSFFGCSVSISSSPESETMTSSWSLSPDLHQCLFRTKRFSLHFHSMWILHKDIKHRDMEIMNTNININNTIETVK